MHNHPMKYVTNEYVHNKYLKVHATKIPHRKVSAKFYWLNLDTAKKVKKNLIGYFIILFIKISQFAEKPEVFSGSLYCPITGCLDTSEKNTDWHKTPLLLLTLHEERNSYQKYETILNQENW